MGDEIPDEYEPTMYLPPRIALALQRCVSVSSLDFVGLRFTATTLLGPFQPSPKFRARTGLGSKKGIRELGFEKCAFADDIRPHHFALLSERLDQLGTNARGLSVDPAKAGVLSQAISDSGLELDFERLVVDPINQSASDVASKDDLFENINWNEEYPTWEERDIPELLMSVTQALYRSRIPFGALYGTTQWATPTPREPAPKQFRSLALIRNPGIDMASVVAFLQGGWCHSLDELILLCLLANDADLACIAKMCPFLTRLDVGLEGGPDGTRALIDGCPNLVELYLDNSRGDFVVDVAEDAVVQVGGAEHLECLWLPECHFGQRASDAITAMPRLRDLKMSAWPSEIDAEAVIALGRSMSLLRCELTLYVIHGEADTPSLEHLVVVWTAVKLALKKVVPAMTTEIIIMHLLADGVTWETTTLSLESNPA